MGSDTCVTKERRVVLTILCVHGIKDTTAKLLKALPSQYRKALVTHGPMHLIESYHHLSTSVPSPKAITSTPGMALPTHSSLIVPILRGCACVPFFAKLMNLMWGPGHACHLFSHVPFRTGSSEPFKWVLAPPPPRWRP